MLTAHLLAMAFSDICHCQLFHVQTFHLLEKLLFYQFLNIEPTSFLRFVRICLVHRRRIALRPLLLQFILSLHKILGPLSHKVKGLLIFLFCGDAKAVEGTVAGPC